MVGDSDCPMSPGGCLLDGILGIGQGIHIGHNGMQVQLYTLVPSGIVFSLFHCPGHHSHWAQYHFIIKLVDLQSALHLQHGADFYIFQNRFCFIVLHKAVNLHRAVVIGHGEIDDPRVPLFQFLMLNAKYSAFNNDTTHIQIQFPHRGRRSLKGFAKEGWVVFHHLFFLLKDRGLGKIG